MRTLRDPERKPIHPGTMLREDVLPLPALRMTQTELARRLGVSRVTISELLLEKAPPEPRDRGSDRAAAQHHAGVVAADAGSLGRVEGAPTPRKAGRDSTIQVRTQVLPS
jgi:hypothetical protein